MPKPLWAPWRLEYVEQADELDRCIFCDPEEALLVHRGEHAVVVLNKYPYASGHLLVAPHRHLGDFGVLADEEALEDTNESVIQHRQNDVLRVLTVFSVVLLPLTLITGFFGMNVHFPGFETAWAFWTIFGVMAATLIGLLTFFRLKRWL